MDDEMGKRARSLVEAYPYIRRYQGKYFVIKAGGSMLRIREAKDNFLPDIAFLSLVGIRVVIVCGGGPFISEELENRKKKADFIDGMRVTDGETMKIVRGTLMKVRDEFVGFLAGEMGVSAVASDPGDGLLTARKIRYQKGEEIIDLGFVGQVQNVNTALFDEKTRSDVVVMTPIALSDDGTEYNINADSVASAVATALNAEKLMFVTNVPGVMRKVENPETLISILNVSQAEKLIKEGIIDAGMIPKVKSGIASINNGVKKVHIISGNITQAILLEVFTDQGVGTEIVLEETA